MRLLVNGQWQDCDWAAGKTVTQVLNEADVPEAKAMTLKVDGQVMGRSAHVPQDADCLEAVQFITDDEPAVEVTPVAQESA